MNSSQAYRDSYIQILDLPDYGFCLEGGSKCFGRWYLQLETVALEYFPIPGRIALAG